MKPLTHLDLQVVTDRCHMSALLLTDTQAAVHKYQTISSAVKDVDKNAALAWMKAFLFAKVSLKFKNEITEMKLVRAL